MDLWKLAFHLRTFLCLLTNNFLSRTILHTIFSCNSRNGRERRSYYLKRRAKSISFDLGDSRQGISGCSHSIRAVPLILKPGEFIFHWVQRGQRVSSPFERSLFFALAFWIIKTSEVACLKGRTGSLADSYLSFERKTKGNVFRSSSKNWTRFAKFFVKK